MAQSSRTWVAGADSQTRTSIDRRVAGHYLADEAGLVRELCDRARLPPPDTAAILADGRRLAVGMRKRLEGIGALDAIMSEYDLSSREGVLLMCLAEALLRIPDAATADRLIADKLGDADFHDHLGSSGHLLVNVSTWGLMLTGRIVREEHPDESGFGHEFGQLVARLGEPVIRTAMRAAMRVMSEHFVMGRSIDEALRRSDKGDRRRDRYSFDMLGEAALTAADAEDYLAQYAEAIDAIGAARPPGLGVMEADGISVKLSALCPRFEFAQADARRSELVERLGMLVEKARDAGVSVTIDAEEADRLELTASVFEHVYRSLARDADWGGLGIAVQTYQRRGMAVIEWLVALAEAVGVRIPVRLVKGAYWDTEIKLAQQRGLAGYPVFTRKSSTDVSFLACARVLLEAGPRIYPQLATHNPHTAAWAMRVGVDAQFEFQRLHGMGEDLYDELTASAESSPPCRVYAPVGRYADLLPYLVRRLLENGSNTSFVNRFVHAEADAAALIEDPVALTAALGAGLAHPRIRLPRDLFGATRPNSAGLNLADPLTIDALASEMQAAAAGARHAAPLIDGKPCAGDRTPAHDPADKEARIGAVVQATAEVSRRALDVAHASFPEWNETPAAQRADALRAAADLLERRRTGLATLCVEEGGRTVADALAEVREAVDFLRYYAVQAETLYGPPMVLPGPTGERNTLRLTGRGVFVCISPWNFPIAIFTGQIAAALAAGNAVIAKPSEQSALVGAGIVECLFDAGVPSGALQFLPGPGPVIGGALLPDARVAGVAFTGSTATAKRIERMLAARDGPVAALIAETGGVNAMIVDSSALTEQVVRDAAISAFNSAGQRCSALRLLCLQRETADDVITMLCGRMQELVIGDPALLGTDVGPVIDDRARTSLQEYAAAHRDRILYQCDLGPQHSTGHFFPPTLIELESPGDLTREVFGPVLHVVRYERDAIDDVVDALNAVGYGLTLGVQSRIESFAERVAARARIGNIYVNRDMIGAVVESQPFGGFGLSGTGPKAGGPHYLARFGVEQSVTTNTAAVGGNAELLAIGDAGAPRHGG